MSKHSTGVLKRVGSLALASLLSLGVGLSSSLAVASPLSLMYDLAKDIKGHVDNDSDSDGEGGQSFSQTKNILLTKVYRPTDNYTTIYCGCDVKRQGKKMIPDLESCGYKNRNPNNLYRAERIEWEHVVPAAVIGYQNKCMIENKSRKDKRSYCESTDPDYQKPYTDMHNLFPSVGEVNLDRSNFRYVADSDADFKYGRCDMRIDAKAKTVTPPENSHGVIARAYLYMADRYDLKLSDSQRKMFEVWNRQHPADAWEKERNRRIKAIQGNGNPYIEKLD